MKAILSDIHGNLEALEAVLADIRSRGIKEIVCLGDVIGYGPNPRECLELIRTADVLIRGNHEEALLSGEADAFNSRARRAVQWTHEQLMGEAAMPGASESYRSLIEGFKVKVEIDGLLYVHGSPRSPTKEYVTPRDAKNKQKMSEIFQATESVCFVGHSHIPGVFTEEGFSRPDELPGRVYILTGEKALVNVGSVGQPRDGDPRACYVTFDMDTVVFRRVEYDIEPVVAKIRATPSLDNTLGERLRTGR